MGEREQERKERESERETERKRERERERESKRQNHKSYHCLISMFQFTAFHFPRPARIGNAFPLHCRGFPKVSRRLTRWPLAEPGLRSVS